MNRREEREHKFRLLFSTLFYPDQEADAQIDRYFVCPVYEDAAETEDKTAAPVSEEDAARLKKQVEEILAKIPELDQKIDEVAEGWKTRRMGKVELTILRLALYEMRYDDAVPDKVAINEAVELAKKYGGSDSGAFVNGVLAKLVG